MDNTQETMNGLGDAYKKWLDVLKKYGGKITTPTSEFESLNISIPADENSEIVRDAVTVSTQPSKKDLETLNDPDNLEKWIEVYIRPKNASPKVGKRPDTAIDDYEIECLQVFLSERRGIMEQSIWSGINRKDITIPPDTIVPLQPFAKIIETGNPEITQDMSKTNTDTNNRLENIFQQIKNENFTAIPILY